jgi:two-component system, chemotaxis family, protein-glutamate methylesterase/glutaminase
MTAILREAPSAAVRVMVCDDSPTIRAALTRILEADPAISVVAKVEDGKAAISRVGVDRVDIVVLDIEMPVMDGITALPQILRAAPGVRVIMASTLTTRGAEIALRALRLGASDYVPKPSSIGSVADEGFRRELLEKVKGLGRMRMRVPGVPAAASAMLKLRPAARLPPRLLAIGSSTGGPQALFTLVQALGKDLPVPIVLTQHMPAAFTPILAEHLGKLDGPICAEARDGETLVPGRLYLAPGDRHLVLEGNRSVLRARLTSDPPENYCRPAVDPMLRSAATVCEGRVLVVMLTGMGRDGLVGTRAVIDGGGTALAQDERTSVVWGMPGAIAQAGLCHAVLPLAKLASKSLELIKEPRS